MSVCKGIIPNFARLFDGLTCAFGVVCLDAIIYELKGVWCAKIRWQSIWLRFLAQKKISKYIPRTFAVITIAVFANIFV